MTEAEIISTSETDLPCVTLLAHDLEIRRIKRRYRIAQVALSIIAAVMFAAYISNIR